MTWHVSLGASVRDIWHASTSSANSSKFVFINVLYIFFSLPRLQEQRHLQHTLEEKKHDEHVKKRSKRSGRPKPRTMCGGAILAEFIPAPSRAAAATKRVTASHLWPAGSKNAARGKSKSKRQQRSFADVDDFEAAFEQFDDDSDFDDAEEEDEGHFVFASKSRGNVRRVRSRLGVRS